MNIQTVSSTLACRLDPPRVAGRIGLIVLSTDEIGDEAFRMPIPPEAARVFTTRTHYGHEDDAPGVLKLATSFHSVADSLPAERPLDVLAFSCTSATVASGVAGILDQLAEARPGLAYTTPGIASLNALKAMGLRRLALLTPYSPDVHRLFIPFFEKEGFEIMPEGTFGLASDADIGELSKDSLFDAARDLTSGGSMDALFVSCTATPIVPHIEELEELLGLPVLTSSQAMAWDALRLIGYGEPVEGFGRLMRTRR